MSQSYFRIRTGISLAYSDILHIRLYLKLKRAQQNKHYLEISGLNAVAFGSICFLFFVALNPSFIIAANMTKMNTLHQRHSMDSADVSLTTKILGNCCICFGLNRIKIVCSFSPFGLCLCLFFVGPKQKQTRPTEKRRIRE